MSTTVSMGDFNVTSNSPAADVVASLTTVEKDAPQPKVLVEDGQNVEERERLAAAAAELGKKGGKATAEKKAAEKDEEADAAKRKVDEEIAAAEPAEKKKLASDRVREATQAAAAAKREAAQEKAARERTEARLAELERRSAPPAEQKAPAGDGKPKLEDFEDHADFIEALAGWKAEKLFAENYEKRKQEAAKRYMETAAEQRLHKTAQAYAERVGKAIKADPDFMARVSPEVAGLRLFMDLQEGERPGPLNFVAEEIWNSERAPELMLHLSKNPEELQRLGALPNPQAITRAMAKLETRLEDATRGTSSPEQEVSKANPPARPVVGSPHIAQQGFRPGMNLDEYARTWKPSKR